MASYVNVMDLIYPIGSYYQSSNSTNPASLFGGTWTQILNKFLLSSSLPGETGGVSSHAHNAGTEYINGEPRLQAAAGACQSDNKTYGYYTDNPVVVWADDTEAAPGGTDKKGDWIADSPFYILIGSNYVGGPQYYFNHWIPVMGCTTESSNIPPYQGCYTWYRVA